MSDHATCDFPECAANRWGVAPLGPDGYRRAERVAAFRYLQALDRRPLVFDGGLGTEIQKLHLTSDDYGGRDHEGCPEVLVATRPEAIAGIHRAYLAAGADVVETCSFGALPSVLAEYGLAGRAAELAAAAAALARREAGPDRFVAGSLGPGRRLPSLGQVTWEEQWDDYLVAAGALVTGGVDLLLIETCQDILQVRCAVLACREAMRRAGREVPIQAQVTVEANGRMLAGTEMVAALAVLEALPVDVVGLNCATGPDLMESHLRLLCERSTRFVACQPNAGLPRNVDGRTVYDLAPADLAAWHARFVREFGLDACGGCCGTAPAHIAATAAALRGAVRAPRALRPLPAQAVSLYQAVDLAQDDGLLLVGERTNATGSKQFRELLLADDLEHMVEMAHEQEAEGVHVLDVSVAWTGRDEPRDLAAFCRRLASRATAPIMVDSTDPRALAAALRVLPGRALINSANFEAGEARFDAIAALAAAHGAALVCLVIDEDPAEPMARTCERKVAVAERLFRRATEVHGLPADRLLFDLLTFPVTQGDAASRDAARQTLDALADLRRRLPRCHYILGVSNVSFGLKPAPRRVLTSVFLDAARRCGLDAAILNASKIVPVSRLDAEALAIARDLVQGVWRQDHDPLALLIARFAGASAKEGEAATDAAAPPRERLRRRILAGRPAGVAADLDAALAEGGGPAALIDQVLLPAMREVGVEFGAGRMQLPFVLQAAECMKACLRHLEPLLPAAGAGRGTVVLATVRGDVHDIGKNLAGMVLANNGFTVVDLGIRVGVEQIHAAIQQHRPLALGLSGLLVRSTEVMREDLAWLAARGVTVPVLCGGAALTADFVAGALGRAYGRPVFHAPDAVAGLGILEGVLAGTAPVVAVPPPPAALRPLPPAAPVAAAPAVSPPVWGATVLPPPDLDAVLSAIDVQTLAVARWGFRRAEGQSVEEHRALIRREAAPAFAELSTRARAEGWLRPAAVGGVFTCRVEGDGLVVDDPSGGPGRRLRFARSRSGRCLSDFFRRDDGPAAVVLQAVTVGAGPVAAIAAARAADRYRETLFLHGLAAEAAEATAELVHRHLVAGLGLDMAATCRYSPGYPLWPALEDQQALAALLGWERIGLRLGETGQLDPEHSTSALVCLHPQAGYFPL